MKKLDLKIKKLCGKLEDIVKYGNGITIDRGLLSNNIYRISSNDLNGYTVTMVFIINENAYFIKVNNSNISNSLGIFVDADNENVKKLMQLIKDKYKSQQYKEKEMIEKIDEFLEILDKINDRIFKED